MSDEERPVGVTESNSAAQEEADGNARAGFSENVKSEIISWVKTIVFAVVFALGINNLVIVNAVVPTGSMENNIMPDDRIVAFRLSYLFDDPQRYDVVVFKYPDDESTLFVKRVIGLPGETVVIRDGKVYINGSDEPLPDDFIKERAIDDYGPYAVPEGCYFMLGDNRNSSKDSRYWIQTYLSQDKILGKVIFRYYPKFKLFTDISNIE